MTLNTSRASAVRSESGLGAVRRQRGMFIFVVSLLEAVGGADRGGVLPFTLAAKVLAPTGPAPSYRIRGAKCNHSARDRNADGRTCGCHRRRLQAYAAPLQRKRLRFAQCALTRPVPSCGVAASVRMKLCN